jgi:hypothetical protein
VTERGECCCCELCTHPVGIGTTDGVKPQLRLAHFTREVSLENVQRHRAKHHRQGVPNRMSCPERSCQDWSCQVSGGGEESEGGRGEKEWVGVEGRVNGWVVRGNGGRGRVEEYVGHTHGTAQHGTKRLTNGVTYATARLTCPSA